MAEPHPRWCIDADWAAEFSADCHAAATDDEVFARFLHLRAIRGITAAGGSAHWVDYIGRVAPGLLQSHYVKLKQIDMIGSPEPLVGFSWGGELSHLILLRIGRAVMIKDILGIEVGDRVAEIGAGYGGFAAVVQALYGPLHYTIYDLLGPWELQQRYLAACGLTARFGDPDDSLDFDLAVSDYAFSELPGHEQKRYAANVLTRSKKGTLLWNIIDQATDSVNIARDVIPMVRGLMPGINISSGLVYRDALNGIPRATDTFSGYMNYLMFWDSTDGNGI